jgi:protein involved in polysaccharide export with SLBB domain
VLDVIMMAGGPNKGARLAGTVVVRQGTGSDKPTAIPANVDQTIRNGASQQNIVMRPGDVVFVPAGVTLQLRDLLETFTGIRLLRWLFGVGL